MSEFPPERHAGGATPHGGRRHRPGRAGPAPGRWVALLVCCSALFMTLLDVSVTNVALPSIGDATGADSSQLQWVIGGYTLAFGLVPVLAGGSGTTTAGGGCSRSASAPSRSRAPWRGSRRRPRVLIAMRVLQGVAGGLINPQVSGLVQQMFRGDERGRAFGALGTTVGLGTALGPLVGGALIALGGPEHGVAAGLLRQRARRDRGDRPGPALPARSTPRWAATAST